MKARLGTIAAALAATLLVAGIAHGAGEQTRESYVAAVEPICKRDRAAAKRILGGVQQDIRKNRLKRAGRKLIRAARRFGTTIGKLARVPRPPADVEKLRRWIGFLRLVERRTRRTGKFLIAGRKVKATHESIRAEKSGNAANNVGFAFEFRYCRLDRSRFG